MQGANSSLYSEDPVQTPYSTGFSVEYTYIPQEIWWNIAIEISIAVSKGTQEHSTLIHNSKQNKKAAKNQTKKIIVPCAFLLPYTAS